MRTPIISAIIACYKDELAIEIMYKRLSVVLKKLKIPYEIIFVNDGSPDKTGTILHTLVNKDPHVIAVHHSRNFSSQMAFLSGMRVSKGKAVVLLDGDLQDPPELIATFYTHWKKGYDVIYGVRTKRQAPLLMQFSYKLFYRIFKRLAFINIPNDAGDFSLIDRRVVDILTTFPERDYFLRGLRAWVGFRQKGIAYTRPERMFGKTTNNFGKNIQWAFKAIFSFSTAPLEFITLLSVVILGLFLIGAGSTIIWKYAHPHDSIFEISVFLAILAACSLQLFAISIIGQYIGKIIEEVKKRPQYIVKKIERKTRS
ncbi:MAG: glycosyltransferase family 2 protein [Candidatus Roizmanbacteria bacterium]|nr:glycosyltransferase family 2 protein [Candidatus Roizmanbacteria bacterium]